MAASESKYRRIFEVSKDMILVSKKDGQIVDMNPAGYKMLGYNESEFFDKKNIFKMSLTRMRIGQQFRTFLKKRDLFQVLRLS
ncbi:MAG: hypothetical protein DRH24_01130 [Deltaproteobacteria bacterium]|nr:MAG: hypothetical protein DRH24_01130 [Deltaproteobacteria bacterium]